MWAKAPTSDAGLNHHSSVGKPPQTAVVYMIAAAVATIVPTRMP